MKVIASAILILTVIQVAFAPPVEQKKQAEPPESEEGGLEDYMEYHRYLKEVVNALESDPDFRKKLEEANEDDIKSGKIADELKFVSHNIRTRLDEIKRTELERLKHLMLEKNQLQNNVDVPEDPTHHHLDHSNPHTFEISDLKKLIKKTTEDLAEADRKRRDEFKQYELQKEYEKQQKLNTTNAEEKEKLEKEFKEREEKHKKHEPLHEPGHKKQLEEVWEEQDHMQQEFNPKVFFMLHDLDSNGYWDENEVKALFIKELDKMYAAGAPEDDMRERVEEMERMRETVFQEMDSNKDGFISYEEFLMQTKRNDFQQDNGWKGLDEQKPYTDEELAEYIRMHQVNQYPPPPPPGYHPQGGYQVPPQGNYYPQEHGYQQNQAPPGGYPNVHPQQQYHPNQAGNHPIEIPVGAFQHQQQGQGGYHPNELPPGAQQAGYQNQIPQGHPQYNQVNVGHQQQNSPQGQINPNQQGYPQQNQITMSNQVPPGHQNLQGQNNQQGYPQQNQIPVGNQVPSGQQNVPGQNNQQGYPQQNQIPVGNPVPSGQQNVQIQGNQQVHGGVPNGPPHLNTNEVYPGGQANQGNAAPQQNFNNIPQGKQ